MKKWLEEEVRLIYYSPIIDTHALFEHINFSKTLVDNSLNTLQSSWKLEIPSVNHAMMINSFEIKFNKFLAKITAHRVATIEDYLF